jgi:hypothetical protein
MIELQPANAEQDIARSEAVKMNLEEKIVIHKLYEKQIIESAREIKNFTDRRDDLATLMIGLVKSADKRRIFEGSLKNAKESIARASKEIGQTYLDLVYTLEDAAHACGTGHLTGESEEKIPKNEKKSEES